MGYFQDMSESARGLLGRELGVLLQVVGAEALVVPLVAVVKLLAAAALFALVLRALPPTAKWGAAVVVCVILLQSQPGDFLHAAPPHNNDHQRPCGGVAPDDTEPSSPNRTQPPAEP
jgi:hypothetical protein